MKRRFPSNEGISAMHFPVSVPVGRPNVNFNANFSCAFRNFARSHFGLLCPWAKQGWNLCFVVMSKCLNLDVQFGASWSVLKLWKKKWGPFRAGWNVGRFSLWINFGCFVYWRYEAGTGLYSEPDQSQSRVVQSQQTFTAHKLHLQRFLRLAKWRPSFSTRFGI